MTTVQYNFLSNGLYIIMNGEIQYFTVDCIARMSRVTEGVARSRTPSAQWSRVLNIGKNLQPFTGSGDVIK